MADKSSERTVLGSRFLGILLEKRKNGTFGEILSDWKWILQYSKRYRRSVAVYAFFGILSTSLSLLSAVAGKYTIDIITGYQTSKLALVLAVMIGSAFLSLGLSSLTSYVCTRISLRITTDIQAEIFSSVLDANWTAVNRFSSGDLLNRFQNDISVVSSNAISWLPDIGIGVYSFLATFFVIWHYDHVMALLALVSAPFLLFSSRRILGKLHRYNRELKKISSDLTTCEAEAFYNLDTVKSMGLTERFGAEFRSRQEVFRKASLDCSMFTIRARAVLSLLGSAVQMTAFCYCLYLLWSGKIVYGTMTLFLSQGSRLSSTFQKLVSTVPAFLTSSVSAHRIRELQELEKEPHLGCGDLSEEDKTHGLSVCAEDLHFSYSEHEIFSDVCFRANPGEIVALIGPSGEGKTTMLRLLLGLISPDRGSMYLKTGDGRKLPANADLRACFSYVPQGNTMLSGTIAENLRMGKADASDEELEQALRLACAWEFVSQLPEGMNSSMGERGRGFSEGQAQRIAIARAIVRNAPILLLDEATSALDADTEKQVLQNIMFRNPAQTCIVTTHRPSVLHLCSRAFLIRAGALQELSGDEVVRAAENIAAV